MYRQAVLLLLKKNYLLTSPSFAVSSYSDSLGKSSSSGRRWQVKPQLFYWQGCSQPSRASRWCHLEPFPLKVLGVFMWLCPHRPCSYLYHLSPPNSTSQGPSRGKMLHFSFPQTQNPLESQATVWDTRRQAPDNPGQKLLPTHHAQAHCLLPGWQSWGREWGRIPEHLFPTWESPNSRLSELKTARDQWSVFI